MPHDIIWELIAKKLSGEASAEELLQLEDLLRANPDIYYPMQTVADIWHHPGHDTEDAQLAFTNHAARMKSMGIDLTADNKPPDYNKAKKRNNLLMVIALPTLFAAICWSFYFFVARPTKALSKVSTYKSEIATTYGSRTNLRLPDGTQVWLNSGTKLTYDKSYGNGTREVSLQGEAYFDVVSNAALPFIIHTVSIDIKVLGTAFNVKSFPGEKNTETSLLRGSIEITFKNQPSKKIILHPNEKLISRNEPVADPASNQKSGIAIFGKDAGKEPDKEDIVQVKHLTYQLRDSMVLETCWMSHKLVFRSEAFQDLAVKMERWYGVTIRFADEKINTKKLNGIFENENIGQALKALQMITPFAYTINGNVIMISSKLK